MKLFKGMEALFNKADNTETRYQEALAKKEEQLIQRQTELQEKEMMLRDMAKMKILGDISEASYQTENEKVDTLRKQFQELQKEINLIEVYQTEDITSLIEELETEKRKAFAKHQVEFKKLQMELLDAKLSYLKKQVEIRERYNQLVAPERKLDNLKIKIGIKKNSYISDAFESLSMVSVGAGYEPLTVQIHEVDSALRYGKLPHQLNKVVSEAKDKGIIE